MKQFYIFPLLICQCVFAQDARIFENYWYLKNVIKDGVSHIPPRPDMGVTFQEVQMLNAKACLNMMALVTFENNESNFSATEFQYCLCWCTDPVADAYESTYFNFFTGGEFDPTLVQNFTYTITEQDDERALIIVSATNEQAIYSDSALATESFKKLDFSYYPNPAIDFVEFKLNNQTAPTTEVSFYNELGKMCKTQHIDSAQGRIDVKDLSHGLYLVKIENGNDVSTKKFVKS